MSCQQFLVGYYTLSLLPRVQPSFLLQLLNLCLQAQDLVLHAGFLSFPGLSFVLYRQFKGFEACYALNEGIPHETAESGPDNCHVGTWRVRLVNIRAKAGAAMFYSQVVPASAYPTDDS